MRILTRKIYRAFPELDRFDDDVCKRYLKNLTKNSEMAQDQFFVVSSVIVSIAIWAVFGSVLAILVSNLFQNVIGKFPYDAYVESFFVILVLSGNLWFPIFVYLLIRDRWLHRCLRKQLSGVQCPACGYSLIGLSVLDKDGRASVHCPECGCVTLLEDMGLTRADIDPTLSS